MALENLDHGKKHRTTRRGFLGSKAGLSLPELITVLAISSIIVLAAAGLFSFGTSQYNSIKDEADTQLSLLEAAYYLRFFLSQAVNTICYNAGASAIPNPYTLPLGTGHPSQVGQGVVDCRLGAPTPLVWPAGQPNALAIFNRENASFSATASTTGGATLTSSFQGTGIYFVPTDGTAGVSGALYFGQDPGSTGNVVASDDNLVFRNLVDIQVQSIQVSPDGGAAPAPAPLEYVTYTITARYFNQSSSDKLYSAAALLPGGYGVAHRDLTMTVSVALHNNWLGLAPDGSQTVERTNGGIYFFKFNTPPLANF